MCVDFVQHTPRKTFDDFDFQRDGFRVDCNVARVHDACCDDCSSSGHCLIDAAYRVADGGVYIHRHSCCPPPLFSPTTFPH